MDFELTQDQKLLADTAQNFVRKESPVSRLRALRQDAIGYSRDVWRKMGELGWLSIVFPEHLGGFGGTFVDAAILLERFGTTLVPEPFVPSVVLAGGAILRLGNEEQQRRFLEPLIAGDTTLALATGERDSRFDVTRVATRATREGGIYKLVGEKIFVLNGHAADELVVSARLSGGVGDRDGIGVFVIDRAAAGLSVRPIKTMDGHHAAMLRFDDVEVGSDRVLAMSLEPGRSATALEEVMDHAAAAACAEGFGIMQTALDMTVGYLKTREQFGVKIGSFQALQHRAVDMFIETELARSTSMMASIKVSDGDPVERMRAVSAAKVQLATAGKFVTQQSIQLHGGIGVTDEHDIGLYFKRMHILNTLFGDEEFHVARFASLPSFTRNVEPTTAA